jgi:hypothetical protein
MELDFGPSLGPLSHLIFLLKILVPQVNTARVSVLKPRQGFTGPLDLFSFFISCSRAELSGSFPAQDCFLARQIHAWAMGQLWE